MQNPQNLKELFGSQFFFGKILFFIFLFFSVIPSLLISVVPWGIQGWICVGGWRKAEREAWQQPGRVVTPQREVTAWELSHSPAPCCSWAHRAASVDVQGRQAVLRDSQKHVKNMAEDKLFVTHDKSFDPWTSSLPRINTDESTPRKDTSFRLLSTHTRSRLAGFHALASSIWGCPGGKGRQEGVLYKGSKEDFKDSHHLLVAWHHHLPPQKWPWVLT